MIDFVLTDVRRNHMATLAAEWLGCAPEELTIEPARHGRSTPVYRIVAGTDSCFLRLSESPAALLGSEALAHEVVLSHGARVPAIIGYEPFDRLLERSVMLTTAIPGKSLEDAMPAEPARTLIAAGADLARINSVPVDGYGWIQRDDPLPTRLSASYPSWEAFAASLTAQPLDNWFEAATVARLASLATTPPFETDQAVLAHGDFDRSHIFTLHDRYAGIIDFGEMRGAEPTFDLGHLALHAPEALPGILTGYASVLPLPGDVWRQIDASAVRIGWFRLTQSSARTNPPYADQLRSSMLRLTSNFEPTEDCIY